MIGRRTLDEAALRDAAVRVLQGNDRGRMTVAAPRLYPHQWSWDAAFVAVGLAHLSVPRAFTELEHLLDGQWSTGMIPHIVFDDAATDYFPGPDYWACAEVTDAASRHPRTSGICQPPAHAIAIGEIVRVATRRGEREAAMSAVGAMWPGLLAWHRWLIEARRSPTSGLVAIVHGWESGTDDSPRFDEAYRRVEVGALPAYERSDLRSVVDARQRPTDADYDRYLWLVEEMRAARYDQAAVVAGGGFLVGDVMMTALLALACDVLTELAPEVGAPHDDGAWLAARADELRAAVAATVDDELGIALDRDERHGAPLPAETIAGFAPLLCGGLETAAHAAMLDRLFGSRWAGHEGLVARLPPSTSPASAAFDPRRYWRGPMWPVMVWLFAWALDRRGYADQAGGLRDEGLRLVADGNFGEYYEPYSGEWLGSADQSWTAAVTLDWLATH